ncbi:hypothetical protein BDP27DRAFT_1438561 [Rhodocollybia butyracea]|uniref:Uncharacterized protein n=1 Tax=Rhodocollybia butyracea TaxID=206335 RepID=A0A9P5TWK4_9AGAR|nr:hypothetical protein BDP27DRAFT_1438561 [Rhodocollybia butyracea]
MNEFQTKILRAIFFGKQSLSSEPESFNYATHLVGMLWGVKTVNDSSIALSAVLLRFLLSEDTEFTAVGKNSKLNYRNDFISYRNFLNGSKGSVTLAFYTLSTTSVFCRDAFSGNWLLPVRLAEDVLTLVLPLVSFAPNISSNITPNTPSIASNTSNIAHNITPATRNIAPDPDAEPHLPQLEVNEIDTASSNNNEGVPPGSSNLRHHAVKGQDEDRVEVVELVEAVDDPGLHQLATKEREKLLQ